MINPNIEIGILIFMVHLTHVDHKLTYYQLLLTSHITICYLKFDLLNSIL